MATFLNSQYLATLLQVKVFESLKNRKNCLTSKIVAEFESVDPIQR